MRPPDRTREAYDSTGNVTAAALSDEALTRDERMLSMWEEVNA